MPRNPSGATARALSGRGRAAAAGLVLAFAALLATSLAAHGANNARLQEFRLEDRSGNELPFVYPFDPYVTSHYAWYTSKGSIVILKAVPEDPDATVRLTQRPIFFEAYGDGGVQGTYYAEYGYNHWTVEVTSENGASTRQYSVQVRRWPPGDNPYETPDADPRDASLSSLLVGRLGNSEPLDLDPSLRTNLSVVDLQDVRNRTYTVTVPHDQDKAWVRATATADNARVVILDGGGSRLDSENIDLEYGNNVVRVRVTPDNPYWERVHYVTIIRQRPPNYSNALTAIFTDPGIETEGSGGRLVRTVELALSEAVQMPASELKNHGLTANGGTVDKVKRVGGSVRYVNGSWVTYTDRWRIRVTPDGTGSVILFVTGNRPCDLDGALCTDDGRGLLVSESITLAGSELLEVSIDPPAEGGDEDDGVMWFEISLSRAAVKPVQVRFRTIDSGANSGTATANVDYRPADYQLGFSPGETTLDVPVALFDDTIDDNGETVVAEISEARLIVNRTKSRAVPITSPSRVTGTIYNSDPLPQAWIARFGRTVAEQVVDAVEGRLSAAPSSNPSYLALGGHRLGAATDEAMADTGWRYRLSEEASQGDPAGRDVTVRQLLMGSAFHLAANPDDTSAGPRLSAWGRVSAGGFAGREARLSLDGNVTTATLGLDGAWDKWLTGVALAYSEGDGAFSRGRAANGDVAGTLTSLHPYVSYALSERVRLWGIGGYGSGSLEMAVPRALRTDLDMTMAALGMRAEVLTPPQVGGLALALRSDVLWLRMASAARVGLAASEAEVSRWRLVMEGSRSIALGGGGTLTPLLDLGVRHDGGDAETGSGVEVGASLRYASSWGLSVEASVRGLVTHAASSYESWGAGASLRYAPGESGRGLSVQVTPSWGTASEGAGGVWSASPGGLASPVSESGDRSARLAAELGYGVAAPGGSGLLTPYLRLTQSGATQDWHAGARLEQRSGLRLGLEGSHRDRGGESAHELGLLLSLPW